VIILEVDVTTYANKASASTTKNTTHFKCKIIQNIPSKSNDRFTIEWITNEELSKWAFASILFSFVHLYTIF
jgi:hypothetical protein